MAGHRIVSDEKKFFHAGRAGFLVYALMALSFFVVGCGRPAHKDTAFFMGTFVEVTCENPKVAEIVFKEFERLEKICNLFDEDSELSRLNAKGELVVSRDMFDLLMKARVFYEMTDGAFDVTIAPVSCLWKKAIKTGQMPRQEDIISLLPNVGFDNIYLDEKTRNVKLLKEGVRIDLGGIAKGYALDRSISKLKESGIASVLVNAGGHVYCFGKNHGHPWQVGIRDPRHEDRVIERITLEDRAVATSGDYEQFFIFQNKRYSHIINPKTGYPAESGIVSATVIACDVLTADCLATAFVVLGADKSSRVLRRFQNVKAKLITEDGKILNLSSAKNIGMNTGS